MGAILFIISLVLLYVLSVPLLIYSLLRMRSFKEAGGYFFELAKSVDQFGNAMGKYFFNDAFLSRESLHRFGDIDETISSVMGRNHVHNTLTRAGRGFRYVLDLAFGKGHCVDSIGSRTLKPNIK